MKKILLLGGSPQQVVAIRTSKRLGYETILCDYLTNNPGQFEADRYYPVSTTDKEAVLEIAMREHIDGILAYASDPAAPTAAYVAEQLHLPGNPYNSVEILCNKDKFRVFLREYGFNAPSSEGYREVRDVLHDKGKFCLPIIMKPVDSSGSKGVTVLRQWSDLESAFNFALSYSHIRRVIIEEFIEKKHSYLIGGDIFVSDGEVVLWGLMNCHRDPRVNPLVPVGKSYPPKLKKNDLQHVKEVLQRMIHDLDIRFGSVNVELVIDVNDRVWPIDIGPRAGGNMIPDLLSLIFNTDVVANNVLSAMGIKLPSSEFTGKGFYATYNLHADHDGVFRKVSYSDEIKPHIVRKCLYKQPGDSVTFFSNASDAIGIIFMKFDTEESMNGILEHMDKHIIIECFGGGADIPVIFFVMLFSQQYCRRMAA